MSIEEGPKFEKDPLIGKRVEVFWQQGCDWNPEDYPGARRPAEVIDVREQHRPGVIGMPDIVEVRYDSGETDFVVRSRVEEIIEKKWVRTRKDDPDYYHRLWREDRKVE